MSYRSFGRRFRRREGISGWLSTISHLIYNLAIALCWSEWLHPGSIAPLMAYISHMIWLAMLLVMILAYPFLWLVNRHLVTLGPQSRENAQMMSFYRGMPALFSLGFQIGVLWMFLHHHLDGALLCGSLWTICYILKMGRMRIDSSAILRACAEALPIVAVLFHWGGLAVVWAVVTPFVYLCFRRSLTSFVRNKFSPAEAAQEIRRYVSTKPGLDLNNKVYTGLFWFRNYELWEDARQWLEGYRESEDLAPPWLEGWQTMIALAQGQVALAPEMERLLPQMQELDDACRLTAVAYARLGRREDALRVIHERTELRQQQRSHCLADTYTVFGEWEMALTYYEAADRNAATLYGMATCLARLGAQREARELYRQAIILNVSVRLDYLRDLAECCRRIGDDRMASEAERLIFEKEG